MDQAGLVVVMRKRKRVIWLVMTRAVPAGLALAAILVLGANSWVDGRTEDAVYDSSDAIQANRVGLVLGTSKYLRSRRPNPYFDNRIAAAVELYGKGKVRKLVISGDNRHSSYNEPRDMKQELVKRGIPDADIFLDYAGFRTYDSVFRLKEIFGQSRFTVISQEFHNRRAIFIAAALGLEAVGFNARDVGGASGLKVHARERLARVNAVLDVLLRKRPRFLGEKIEIR